MKEFDEQEHKIAKELVRNPRISDNQIGKITGIPVKTVNRKRKNLEKAGILSYMTFVNHGENGTGRYHSQYMYVIKFRYGITTLSLSQKFPIIMNNPSLVKHTLFSTIGEKDGHVVLIIMLESTKHSDIVEIFNAEIVTTIGNLFGPDAIADVDSMALRRQAKILHNYMPCFNMENGVLKKDCPDHNLFI